MLNEQLLGRWNYLKNKISVMTHLVQDKIHGVKEHEVSPDDIHIENYQYESHRFDDLPLTLNKDAGPGIKYDYTENSEFARGAEKASAHGIDSFGEQDTFDPDEADEGQDFRNRKQNSDLGQRYYTNGMDLPSDDLH